jgi:hypothetical protein
MSVVSNECNQTSILRRPMPLWLAATIVGAFLGGFATFQVMLAVGYNLPDLNNTGETGVQIAEMRATMEEMMGRSMMAMMARMGGGRASEQQSLTELIGKLDLLSIGLKIELAPEQAEKLASTLAKLDQAEKMTSDEAHEHFDAIQSLLSEEQKAALAAVGLPRGGRSDNSGTVRSGDAPPGLVSTPPGSVGPQPNMMGSGMMGPPSDDNPFQQEINQTCLHDFLDRLRRSSVGSPDVSEEL